MKSSDVFFVLWKTSLASKLLIKWKVKKRLETTGLIFNNVFYNAKVIAESSSFSESCLVNRPFKASHHNLGERHNLCSVWYKYQQRGLWMHVNTFMNANGTFTIQSSASEKVKELEHGAFAT